MIRERKTSISIGFTQEQLDKLDRLKNKSSLSMAEHVRKAVDEYLKNKK